MSSIQYIQNQPISFYKQNPTTQEIEHGFTAWGKTAYHKRLGECYFVSPEYCHPFNKDSDFVTFQFKASTIGDNVLDPFSTPLTTALNDTVVSNKLVDTGNDFVSLGITGNMMVFNLTDQLSTYVTSVDSTTTLSINNDIFLATNKIYQIYPVLLAGTMLYDFGEDGYKVSIAAPATGVIWPSAMEVNTWYKIEFEITSIVAGSIDIKLGTNTVATINSIGTHVLYGKCLSNGNFSIAASSSFIGSIDRLIFVTELLLEYTIAIFDLQDNIIAAFPWIETSNSLTIGNIFVNSTAIGHLDLPCGKYVFGLYQHNLVPCIGEMIQNGNFSSPVGWNTDTGITITSGHAEFSSVNDGNYLVNALQCQIVEGLNYTLHWDISALGGTKNGKYHIETGGIISPDYLPGLQSGTQTLIFTAGADSSNLSFSIILNGTTFVLDNVTLVCTSELDLDMSGADGLSECYCICDENECTVKVEYSSNKPTFGNYFDGNNNRMQFRVNGRLRNANNNDIEINPFKSTLDIEIQPYNNLNRIEEISSEPLPEWVHGSLSVGLSHSLVWIDGVAYRRTGAYTPNFGDSELSNVIVNIAKENQQNLRNNY